MKQTEGTRETEKQEAIGRIDRLEENWRKNNIVISSLEDE
jgi:hypothetical protein